MEGGVPGRRGAETAAQPAGQDLGNVLGSRAPARAEAGRRPRRMRPRRGRRPSGVVFSTPSVRTTSEVEGAGRTPKHACVETQALPPEGVECGNPYCAAARAAR